MYQHQTSHKWLWYVLSFLPHFIQIFDFLPLSPCRLPTEAWSLRNSNSDWDYTLLHTHIPEGAQWGWKQEVVKFTLAHVRTVIYPY